MDQLWFDGSFIILKFFDHPFLICAPMRTIANFQFDVQLERIRVMYIVQCDLTWAPLPVHVIRPFWNSVHGTYP